MQPDQKKDLPRLLDRKAVAIGSLVGTPPAGGLLLMVNAWRLGQRGGAAVALVMGLVLTYSLLGLVGYVGQYTTPLVLLVLGAAVMSWVAGVLQGDVLVAHRRAGGRHVGLPAAVLVGVLTSARMRSLSVLPSGLTERMTNGGTMPLRASPCATMAKPLTTFGSVSLPRGTAQITTS